jgi:hypothetical protein
MRPSETKTLTSPREEKIYTRLEAFHSKNDRKRGLEKFKTK